MKLSGVRYEPVGAVMNLNDEAHELLRTEDLADFLRAFAAPPAPLHRPGAGSRRPWRRAGATRRE